MLMRLAGEAISFEIFSSDDLWRVKVDPVKIEQAVMNLVANARDAMPSGGKLRLQIKNCELDEAFTNAHCGAQMGQYVALRIEDNGCGMSRKIQAHIFEPFFTTKSEFGTGLGLSNVYGIIKQRLSHP
jgi:signal transduction histidine kinase